VTAAALPGFPRPIVRRRELVLLMAVAGALALGSLSLSFTRTGSPSLAQPAGLVAYLGALAAVHVALVVAGRRIDEVLLPAVGLLGGIGLLLAERLRSERLAGRGALRVLADRDLEPQRLAALMGEALAQTARPAADIDLCGAANTACWIAGWRNLQTSTRRS
jgi:hypothetical protein